MNGRHHEENAAQNLAGSGRTPGLARSETRGEISRQASTSVGAGPEASRSFVPRQGPDVGIWGPHDGVPPLFLLSLSRAEVLATLGALRVADRYDLLAGLGIEAEVAISLRHALEAGLEASA